MKTKILSMLLTVVMLVATIPAVGVIASAEETTGTTGDGLAWEKNTDNSYTVTVNSADDITKLINDETYNVVGNTMKLGEDLTYSGGATSADELQQALWNGLKTNVDGDGNAVILNGGYYNGHGILYDVVTNDDANITSDKPYNLTFKNLSVKTNGVVTSTDTAYMGLFSALGENGTSDSKSYEHLDLTIENCCFDVEFKVEKSAGTATNNGVGILFGWFRKNNTLNITTQNSLFKASIVMPKADSAESDTGTCAAFVGMHADNTSVLTVNTQNCVYDIDGFYEENGEKKPFYSCCVIGDIKKPSDSYTGNNNLVYDGRSITTNNPTYSDVFETVVAGENTVTTVKGYQSTAVAENKFDLRLVGLVDVASEEDLANYSKVGFVVVANYANINTKWTSAASNKVYESLKGYDGETGLVTYEAPEGDYLYALAIKNIPANAGDITFNVTPYYIKADGTTVYGATTQFTVDVSELPDNTVNAAV